MTFFWTYNFLKQLTKQGTNLKTNNMIIVINKIIKYK